MGERIPNHRFHRWLVSAERYESKWRRGNQQCFAYYDGDQWTPEEQYEIESRGQQPTVINTVQPTVDMVRSIELDRKADIQVVGREESDGGKAQLLTALLKHAFDTCNFEYYHSECFREALIGGRSWIECGIRQDETGRDVISIDHVPWENVFLDPHSRKPDASDARFIIRVKWIDRDIVKRLYPDSDQVIDSVFSDDYHGQEYAAQMDSAGRDMSSRGFYYDTRNNRIKVCECWYSMPEYRTVSVTDERTGRPTERRILKNVIHYVVFSDEVILQGSATSDSANVDELGIDMYPLIPIHCARDRDGRPRGIVAGLISIQDQINKLDSKFLWTIATNRLIAEEGAVRDLEEAREEMQKPDGLVVLNDGGLSRVRVDDKYRDLSYLSAHLNFLLSTEQRISGINDSMLGMGSSGERSGVMQATRISQGAAMQSSVLESLYFSKQRIALVCLRLMGRYYTDWRVIRITQPNGMSDEYQFNVPAQDGSGGLLNEIGDTLHYDVVLKRVQPFTTMRERTLQMFSEVFKTGVIPPQVAGKLMLMLADIPNREDLIMEVENFYKGQAMSVQGAGVGAGPATGSAGM